MGSMPKIQYRIRHMHVADVHIHVSFILIRKLNVGMRLAWECVSHLVILYALLPASEDVLIIPPMELRDINQESEEAVLEDVL